MPVILHERIPDGEIIIWRTEEDYPTLAGQAYPADLESSLNFANISRRTEHLAARAALRQAVPDGKIMYNSNGAPYLENKTLHIGLSHCKGAAAAIVCDHTCGIDIEDTERDFSRVATRFLSPSERRISGSDNSLYLPAVWSAKEALYKCARVPGLNLIDDIEIMSADFNNLEAGGVGIIEARIGEKEGFSVTVGLERTFIFCYTLNITGGI